MTIKNMIFKGLFWFFAIFNVIILYNIFRLMPLYFEATAFGDFRGANSILMVTAGCLFYVSFAFYTMWELREYR